jgi:hypothetical protein
MNAKGRPNLQATMAAELLFRWGLVAGAPDGVDEAGRQKMRMLSVDEAVARACDMAAAFFVEVEKRDWVIKEQ